MATRFGQLTGVTNLGWRAKALWLLGYPEAALADADHALKDAREIGQAATLLAALSLASFTRILCGNYTEGTAEADELVALADERTLFQWKGIRILRQGSLLVLTGKASDAVQMINSGIVGYRSTGSTMWLPLYLSDLGIAYAEVCEVHDAWRCIGEALSAIETTKERWFEAEANRIAGDIALKSPERETAKAEAYFERALSLARRQQAKSWELRAAMSMARLWRDQGKREEARDLLAPVYGWFTEGFDTRDLKEAKALLEELAA